MFAIFCTKINSFTCIGGQAEFKVPSLSWEGAQLVEQSDGTKASKSQSFAVVVEDLDYPYGIGQSDNQVFTHFVAFNVPGNWTSLNDDNAFTQ